MSSRKEKLTAKQEQGLSALLCSPSVCEAARVSGIADVTLRRWLHQPHFQRAYRDARRQALEAAVARLQAISSEAVQTLQSALTSPRASDRIRAAIAILDHAFGGTQLLEIAEDIRTLKDGLAAVSRTPDELPGPLEHLP